jgi:hypothetical protein
MDRLKVRVGRGQTQNLLGHVSIPGGFCRVLYFDALRVYLFLLHLR